VTALDGVRGVAACVVVISHLIAGFYPALFFGAPDEARFALQHAIANSPLFVLYSGTFAVYIFFVLSGFVIAASAMRTRCGLLVLALTRYLRLAVPVLASVLLALALMWAFPGAPQRASAIVGNWWLDFMYQPPYPSLYSALREGFYTVYWLGVSYFNNVLWTMRIEFVGSVSVYAVYLICAERLRLPVLALLAGVALFAVRQWPTNLLGFFLGALLFEGWRRGRLSQRRIPAMVLLVIGILLGGLPFQPAPGTVYHLVSTLVDRVTPAFSTVRTVGEMCLRLGVLQWSGARSWLESCVPQFLGRISFAVYLVHFPILCLGMSELFVAFGQYGRLAMGLSILGYVSVTLLTAYGFTLMVDEPTVRGLGRLKKIRFFLRG